MQGIADSLDIGGDLEPAISDQTVVQSDAKDETMIAEEESEVAIVGHKEVIGYGGEKYIRTEAHDLIGQPN